MKCGKPDTRDVVGEDTKVSQRRVVKHKGHDRHGTTQSYVEHKERIEKWTYDFGKQDFIYVLTFKGGTLSEIETGGYGTYEGGRSVYDRKPAEGKSHKAHGPRSGQRGSTEGLKTPPGSEAMGRIEVKGSPHGAKVYLEDAYAGEIPCVLNDVEPRSHRVVVRMEGYEAWKEKVRVSANKTLSLKVNLKPLADSTVQEAAHETATPAKKLYKWTDKSGQVHITDTPPSP